MKKIAKFGQSLLKLSVSKTAKNTYFVTIGNGISAFFAFIFTVLAVRLLSISDFGYFSALLSFILLVSDVADIGIGSSLSRFLPPMENNKNRLLSFFKTALFLQFAIAFGLLILIISFSSLLTNIIFHRAEFHFLIILTSFGVLGSILTNFYLYTLMARQRFILASMYMILAGALRLVLVGIYALIFPLSLLSLMYIQVVSLILGAILGLFFIDQRFWLVKRTQGDLKMLLSFSSYLGVARSLTAIAGKLDVLMLVSIAGSVEAGIYATASKVIAIYPLLSGSFSSVVAPRFSSILNRKDLMKFTSKVILGTLAFIATIFVMIFIANPFIKLLFGEKSLASVPVFQLLLVAMIFFVGSIPAVSLAIYHLKQPQILTINSVLQVTIAFVGNLLLIPALGRFGPAVVLLIAFGITWVLTTLLSYRALRNRYG